MNTDSDADLRALFRNLRAADDAAIPAFGIRLKRAPVRVPGRTRFAWSASGFALAAVAGFWLVLRPPAFDPTALALPGWPTPTDILLADASVALQRLPWTNLPTETLGRPSFSRYREDQ